MTRTHSNVAPFRTPASIAIESDRAAAARVIAERLRRLAADVFFQPYPHVTAPSTELFRGSLRIRFSECVGFIYFGIDESDFGRLLMTGHIYPYGREKYDDGRLHVMTWRHRGWERERARARRG